MDVRSIENPRTFGNGNSWGKEHKNDRVYTRRLVRNAKIPAIDFDDSRVFLAPCEEMGLMSTVAANIPNVVRLSTALVLLYSAIDVPQKTQSRDLIQVI